MNKKANMMQQYSEFGFCEGKFDYPDAILNMRELCEQFIQKNLGEHCTLASYHDFIQTEEQHRELHYQLTQVLRAQALHKKIMHDNIEVFASLVGSDIDIQIEPYLRISRPNEKDDNIGLHRDTFYGNSPYEISCIVALDEFAQGAAVNVWPKSQHFGEVKFKQKKHEIIQKGSKQSNIGFLYAPKEILNINYNELYAPLLKVGEYLMFSLGVIHGQEVNSAARTRWSFDFRFKCGFHSMDNELKEKYYESFQKSPATLVGEQYISAMAIKLNNR